MPTGDTAYSAPDNVPIGDYVTAVGRSFAPNHRFDETPHWPGGDDGYVDHPAGEWAPSNLATTAEGIPDAHRMRTMPLYDYRPVPSQPAQDWYEGPTGTARETLARHRAVETVDGDGWRMFRGLNRKRPGPDPRWTPPPEPRVTNELAPTTYSYTRPFDQDIERRFNGQHFSMADHRRTYDVYGMQPVSNRRNTYRADPQPWDTDIVDRAPEYTPAAARITPVDLPFRGTRRLM